MNSEDAEYLDFIAECLTASSNSFAKTGNVQHLADFLAAIGSLNRLSPRLRSQVNDVLSRAKQQANTLSRNSLSDLAQSIDLSTLNARLQRLQKVKLRDLRHEGNRISTLLIVDDLLDRRDTVHLALQELRSRGVSIPDSKVKLLEEFDSQARTNPALQWGLSSPRPKAEIFETNEIGSLWWWQTPSTDAVVFSERQTVLDRLEAFAVDLQDWLWPFDAGNARRLAPIAGVILLVVVTASLWRRHGSPGNGPPGNAFVASLRDGSRTVTLDREGNLSGFDAPLPRDYADAVAKLLRTPSELGMPREVLQSLNPASSGPVQMGTGSRTFDLLQPVGKIVESAQPPFSWQELPGATEYVVAIYEYGGDEVSRSTPLKNPTWQLSAPSVSRGVSELSRDKMYLWQVTAALPKEKVTATRAAGKPSLFKVLSQSDLERLERAKATGSHLILGLAYSEVGLLDEAESEFRSIQNDNPNNAVAAELERAIQAVKAGISK